MSGEPLSNSEMGLIKQELQAVIDTLIRGCEALDMETAFGMFDNSPDFLMMGTGGSLCDYQTYLNDNVDYLTTCSAFDLTTLNQEIRVLNRDTALFAWAYQVEATLKTGEKDIIDHAGASFVFRKIEGAWKVVYYHESSMPPTRIPAAHSD
jgi:hypothetical protein